MRNVFCQSLVAQAQRKNFVFLTGDLGYKALEPLREAMGDRFINAGVAEQNMIAVAAGLAKEGLRAWTYSIAPFIYARPYEHIRNDVCIHDLPVVLVGNGGGYGYGVMGATHHAIEDYGSLLCLPNIRAYIPAFDSDVTEIVELLFTTPHPAYLRLGVSEQPGDFTAPKFAQWRKLCDGKAATIVVAGPLVGSILSAIRALPGDRRAGVWLLGELPFEQIPGELAAEIRATGHLIVVEEHSPHGSAGEMLARQLLLAGVSPRKFTHQCAQGYPSGLYGSQKFHRLECGLDPEAVLQLIKG
jgi:transketolase